MKHFLRAELRRAFLNWGFVTALFLGASFVAAHVCIDLLPRAAYMRAAMPSAGSMFYPYTVYDRALGMDFASVVPFVFYFTAPLLGALPYLSSLYTDRKSGYVRQLLARGEARRYLAAKHLAVFLSAFAVVVFVLAADFLAAASIFPALPPVLAGGNTTISARAMWHDLFYQNPMLYMIFYTLLDGVWIGLFVSAFVPFFRIMSFSAEAVLFPELVYVALYFLGSWLHLERLVPVYWLMPQQMPFDIRFSAILLETAALVLVTALGYLWEARRNDLSL